MEIEVKAKLAKRCPCCGSNKIMMDNPKWLKSSNLNVASIWCKDCDLKISGYRSRWVNCKREEVPIEEAYRSALTRWNRRCAE